MYINQNLIDFEKNQYQLMSVYQNEPNCALLYKNYFGIPG